MVTPNDFKAVVPDPTTSLCSGFVKALLRLPLLVYQWMVQNCDADGNIGGLQDVGSYMFSATPANETAFYKLCNGQELTKVDYPKLFERIGTIYGTSASSSNFKLPDFRARFPVAVGSFASGASVVIGITGGEEKHTLTKSEMPIHSHSAAVKVGAAEGGIREQELYAPSSAVQGSDGVILTAETGGGSPHNTLPPYMGCYVYIRCK